MQHTMQHAMQHTMQDAMQHTMQDAMQHTIQDVMQRTILTCQPTCHCNAPSNSNVAHQTLPFDGMEMPEPKWLCCCIRAHGAFGDGGAGLLSVDAKELVPQYADLRRGDVLIFDTK